uniref:Cytochrome c biogenesis protein Ccs1 n=1 Tax=Polysiphonia scopulorum TaxID=257860 RepID=A0A1Z1MHG3_9FLOR|nr:cytochrome c biogenesis protein ccs1 [Polysiphonia scopulorum]ARW65517.1 cytochrome c biogenesis protein ccs1 [Polysiphonia scopulorum]
MLFISNLYVKNFVWKFIKKIANLNLALFILGLIIFCCVIGTIIEQDQSYSYYQLNYPNYSLIMTFLGLDHIFHNWWFIVLLIFFNCSLLSCTVFTQFPTLKNARRWKFVYSINDLTYSNNIADQYLISGHSLANVVYSLVRLDFFVFCRNYAIYSYKGLYGRVSPIFVHISIIAILLGSVYSSLSSFVIQELIPCGETFHIKNTIHSGITSNLPSDLLFYVDDFYIDYNINGSIKQFFSSIFTYSNNKKSSKYYLTSVNKPIRMSSLTIYQTDWKVNAIRLNIGNSHMIQKQLISTSLNGRDCWLASYLINEKSKLFFVILNLDNKVLVSDFKGSILAEVVVGNSFYINNIPITVEEIIASTGLQIKSDPGIFFVYLGFFIMMVSTLTSYISYSQVWISTNFSGIKFSGCTNRAVLFFDTDIKSLHKIYAYYSTDIIYISNNYDLTLR